MLKKMVQRCRKGYCYEDLYCIDGWFIKTLPRMLREFSEKSMGVPCCTFDLMQDAHNLPIEFVETVELDDIFDVRDCWKLIILRIAYCFEHLDEFHKDYEDYWNKGKFAEKTNLMIEYKKEAFYLFEKYFWNLWW